MLMMNMEQRDASFHAFLEQAEEGKEAKLC